MKSLITLLLLLLSCQIFAQSDDDYWKNWNKNYSEVDVREVLNYEKHYADSVEKNPSIPPYYFRVQKFRFEAQYTGRIRPIEKDVLASMKNVFKLSVGNPEQLNDLVKSEALFLIDKKEVWMPVQVQILKALKEEVKENDNVLLYCLFMNEHNSKNELFTTFLISEFIL